MLFLFLNIKTNSVTVEQFFYLFPLRALLLKAQLLKMQFFGDQTFRDKNFYLTNYQQTSHVLTRVIVFKSQIVL